MAVVICTSTRLMRNHCERFVDCAKVAGWRFWIANKDVSLHPDEWAAMAAETEFPALAIANASFHQIKFEPKHLAHLTHFAATGYNAALSDKQLEQLVECGGHLQHLIVRTTNNKERAIRALVQLIDKHALVTLETNIEEFRGKQTLIEAAIRSPAMSKLYLYFMSVPDATTMKALARAVDRSHCKTLTIEFESRTAVTITPDSRVTFDTSGCKHRNGNMLDEHEFEKPAKRRRAE